jgi:hypothetical protein
LSAYAKAAADNPSFIFLFFLEGKSEQPDRYYFNPGNHQQVEKALP